MKKLPYKEGDWILIPLKSGGYAVGRVARMDGKGGIIGYFFGSRHHSVPKLDELRNLLPKDTIGVYDFGDLGLLESKWRVLGSTEPWRREKWPIPVFVREENLFEYGFRYHKVIHVDDKIGGEIAEEPITKEDAEKLPKDTTHGDIALEIVLDKSLPQ